MFSIKDKAVIITGGAQGLGRQFALSMAKEGAKILISDLNIEKANNVVKEIKDAGGVAESVAVDVSNEEDCFRMADTCLKKFGKIDILINSAAIFSTIKVKPFLELPKKEWDDLMSVNLTGVFNCCKAVVPHMKEKNWGRIINVTSCSFFEGRGNYAHYVSSKAGVIGLTRAVAREVGNFGITVNAIAPGATMTEVPRETVNKDWAENVKKNRMIQRTETPEDLVGIAFFMASEEASFMTGQTVVVDGGMVFLP